MNLEYADSLFPPEPNKYTLTLESSTADYRAQEKRFLKDTLRQKTFHRHRNNPVVRAEVAKRRGKNKVAKKARRKNRKP